mgnify:CR=1 FL=1
MADIFSAKIDADGKFEAELPPGKYVVGIRLPAAASDEREEKERRYSNLEVEVPATGDAVLELKATSKK